MRHVINIANGPMITKEQDFITDIIPRIYEIDKAYTTWVDAIETIKKEIMKEAAVSNPEAVDAEVGSFGYARDMSAVAPKGRLFVHKELYHTCYPITLDNNKPDSTDEKRVIDGMIQLYDAHVDVLWKSANHSILLKLFKTMADKGYAHLSYVMNLSRLFNQFIKYNATLHGSISIVEFKTVLNKNQKKPILVLEVSSFTDIPHRDPNTWSEWDSILRGTPILLAHKQMVLGMDTYRSNVDPLIIESDTNWIFQLSTNEVNGSNALVLISCKEINTGNTYGLTIMNRDFTLNTASNIKMQVVKGSEFRFTATIDRAIMHGISIQVRGGRQNTILTNTPNWSEKLKEYGIVIENIQFTASGCAIYNVMIESQTRDITICLEAVETSQLNTFLPKLGSTTVSLNHYTITIPGTRSVTALSTNINDKHVPVLDVPVVLNFPVTVGIYDATRIKAYALPLSSYSNPSITDGIDATVLDIGTIIPSAEAGFLSLMISVNKISRKVLNNEKVLLLRIVFETGSLYSTHLNEEKITELIVNNEMACQIEIDMGVGRVGSYYSGYTYGSTGTTTWHPSSLTCLAMHNLNIMYVPYTKWAILSTMDRSGLLSLKSDYKLEDVPTGIPDESNYRSCVLSDPIDEDKYFGVVKIPHIVYHTWGLQTPNPTLVNFSKITVKSNTRQLFNISCESCAYSDPTSTAIYINPKLVYDVSGYVLLPILFSNVDSVVITVDSYHGEPIDYTINVDLGELPKVDDPEQPTLPGTEPSEGEEGESTPTTPSNSDDTEEKLPVEGGGYIGSNELSDNIGDNSTE